MSVVAQVFFFSGVFFYMIKSTGSVFWKFCKNHGNHFHIFTQVFGALKPMSQEKLCVGTGSVGSKCIVVRNGLLKMTALAAQADSKAVQGQVVYTGTARGGYSAIGLQVYLMLNWAQSARHKILCKDLAVSSSQFFCMYVTSIPTTCMPYVAAAAG